MAPEYKFVRIKVTKHDDITAQLSAFALEGWRVVSHADGGNEYSFVLQRPAETRNFGGAA